MMGRNNWYNYGFLKVIMRCKLDSTWFCCCQPSPSINFKNRKIVDLKKPMADFMHRILNVVGPRFLAWNEFLGLLKMILRLTEGSDKLCQNLYGNCNCLVDSMDKSLVKCHLIKKWLRCLSKPEKSRPHRSRTPLPSTTRETSLLPPPSEPDANAMAGSLLHQTSPESSHGFRLAMRCGVGPHRQAQSICWWAGVWPM